MDDGIEPFEILARDIADIFADMWHGLNAASRIKGTALIEIAVESDDFVARPQQHRDHHGSDVTQMPCHHYTHCRSPLNAPRSSVREMLPRTRPARGIPRPA